MNNEPVAWLVQYKDRHKFVFEKPTVILACEPLYTHPVKELTDEEIQQAYVEHCKNEPSGKGNLIDFARAILRKARNNG